MRLGVIKLVVMRGEANLEDLGLKDRGRKGEGTGRTWFPRL